MRSILIVPGLVLALVMFARLTSAQQGAAPGNGDRGLVTVHLNLPDGEKFSGVATIRLLTLAGSEVAASAENSEGQIRFADISPASYMVEVTTPGFVPVKQTLELSADRHAITIFLTMTPESPPSPAVSGSSATPSAAPSGREEAEKSLQALRQADSVPPVSASVACPLPLVLKGVAERVEELVNNLDRFSATERVEHFTVRADGELRAPEARSFEYVVVVSRNGNRDFGIDEYRNGSMDPSSFPAGIATLGLPGLALIFQSELASGFNFVCEGLGESGGRPAWQVHFEQRLDRPNHIRRYVVGKNYYAVPLKGRVMIDAGTLQVLRMESELIKPVPEIKLTQEQISIDYVSVQFRTDQQQLWLPKTAELYVERNKSRYYRRHTFSDFQVFTVGTSQKVHPPR